MRLRRRKDEHSEESRGPIFCKGRSGFLYIRYRFIDRNRNGYTSAFNRIDNTAKVDSTDEQEKSSDNPKILNKKLISTARAYTYH